MTLLYIILAFAAGLVVGAALAHFFPLQAPPSVEKERPKVFDPPIRCHTITYTYSDGSRKTFHRCQGHTEFTDAYGRAVAPSGVSLVSATGGVHTHGV